VTSFSSLFTFLVTLILSLQVFAAKPKATLPAPQPAPAVIEQPEPQYTSRTKGLRHREIFKKLSINGFYNLNDSGNFEATLNGQGISGTIKSTSSYGVGADVILKNLDNGVLVKGFGSYEFSRAFNSLDWRSGNESGTETLGNPKPQLSTMIVGLQGELDVDDGLSIFAGGNFNFPTIKNSPGSYSGKFGWQAGASMLISENLYVDAMWRSLNMSGSQNKLNYDNINFSGMMVRGRMTFN
jgi:hypothetical protein